MRIGQAKGRAVENDRSELRWGVEQRLEFIEFRLFWEGHVNRSDVMEQFGLSVNQASSDLNRYIGFAPDNMVYDKSARTYVRGPGFKALFLQPDAGRYLAQLRSVAEGILDPEDSWIAEHPVYDAAPSPVRGVNPATLRSVVGAIRRAEAIEVKYQSLSRPDPVWRWIAPHAIAFDGFRWHARAFCLTDEAFKDFLLSRILDIRGSRESGVLAENDHDWNTVVTLEIGPHPALTKKGASPVVFCRFLATAEHVRDGLRKAFPKLVVEAVTGVLTPDERRDRVAEMASADDEKEVQRILVATDCLSEGINLQQLFDTVIHYDLSWNPTRHQQREGRVDRFGQPAELVRSIMMFSPDSAIDGAVLDVVLRKAEEIRKATGI